MIFNKTLLPGLFEIELEKRQDDRGFFARFFCVNEYKDHGLEGKIVQQAGAGAGGSKEGTLYCGNYGQRVGESDSFIRTTPIQDG